MKPYQVLVYSFCGSLMAVLAAWLIVATVGSYWLRQQSLNEIEQFHKNMAKAFPGGNND